MPPASPGSDGQVEKLSWRRRDDVEARRRGLPRARLSSSFLDGCLSLSYGEQRPKQKDERKRREDACQQWRRLISDAGNEVQALRN